MGISFTTPGSTPDLGVSSKVSTRESFIRQTLTNDNNHTNPGNYINQVQLSLSGFKRLWVHVELKWTETNRCPKFRTSFYKLQELLTLTQCIVSMCISMWFSNSWPRCEPHPVIPKNNPAEDRLKSSHRWFACLCLFPAQALYIHTCEKLPDSCYAKLLLFIPPKQST